MKDFDSFMAGYKDTASFNNSDTALAGKKGTDSGKEAAVRSTRVFVVLGGPGMGKSCIAAALAMRRRNLVAAVHFCHVAKEKTRDVRRMVQSLAFQLVCRFPATLLDTLAAAKALAGNEKPAELLDTLIRAPLAKFDAAEEAAGHKRLPIAIVIDALDEAEVGRSRNSLLQLITEKFSELPEWVKLVVTSRPEADVKRELQALGIKEVDPHDQRHIADMKLFVAHLLQASPSPPFRALVNLPVPRSSSPKKAFHQVGAASQASSAPQHEASFPPPPLFLPPPNLLQDKLAPGTPSAAAVVELLGRSGGVFAYVAQVSETHLRRAARGSLTLEDIKRLPDGLDATYVEAFKRLMFQRKEENPFTGREDDVDDIKVHMALLLQLLLAFQEPPTLPDIAWAAEETPSSKNHAYWRAGLAALGSLFPRSGPKERGVFAPFHKSVVDYLMADPGDDDLDERAASDLPALKPRCLLEKVTRQQAASHQRIARRATALLRAAEAKFCDTRAPVIPFFEPWWHICRYTLLHAAQGMAGELSDPDVAQRVLEACDDLAAASTSLVFVSAQLEEGGDGLARLLRGLQLGRVALQRGAAAPPVSGQAAASAPPPPSPEDDLNSMWRFVASTSAQLERNPRQLFTEALSSPPGCAANRAALRLEKGGLDLRHEWRLFDEDRPSGFPACLVTLEGHKGQVQAVAFSPNGAIIASGSDDGAVKLWDAATDSELRTLTGHTRPAGRPPPGRPARPTIVRSVAFSADNLVVASGSEDYTAKTWDVSTGALLRTFEGHEGAITSMALCGTLLASGSRDKTVKLWNTSTGAELRTLRGGQASSVLSVALSPDGTKVASGSGGGCILWDAALGTVLHTLTGLSGPIWSIAFSPNSAVVATSVGNGFALFDVATGAMLRMIKEHASATRAVAISSDGTRVASGGGDCVIKLCDVTTGAVLRTLEGHSGSVFGVAFSPAANTVVSSSGDSTVRTAKYKTGPFTKWV